MKHKIVLLAVMASLIFYSSCKKETNYYGDSSPTQSTVTLNGKSIYAASKAYIATHTFTMDSNIAYSSKNDGHNDVQTWILKSNDGKYIAIYTVPDTIFWKYLTTGTTIDSALVDSLYKYS